MVQLSHPYMTTGKTVTLTIWTFVGKVTSLLFKRMSRFVKAFLPKNKHLLISWLQSPLTVIVEPPKRNLPLFLFFPHLFYEVMGLDTFTLAFWMLILCQLFHSHFSPSSRGSLVPLHFLPLEWYHLHIWGCWYFSQQSWLQPVIQPAQHFTWCTLHIS